MRWVIVLSLFAALIYQSNQIVELKRQLITSMRVSISLYTTLAETEQQYDALAKACLK